MKPLNLSGRLAQLFLRSRLTPLLALLTLALGGLSVWLNAKEEEPSIVVPVADVLVGFPGRSAAEVDERLARPLAAFIREVPTVEHVTSMADDDGVLLVVQFKEGTPSDRALAALRERLDDDRDQLPGGSLPPQVKPRGVEDVPVLALVLWDDGGDAVSLRRLGAALQAQLLDVPGVGRVELTGGSRRAFAVGLDAPALAAHGVSAARVVQALQAADVRLPAGSLVGSGLRVEAGGTITRREDLAGLVVGATGATPVVLRDVATVTDGLLEPTSTVTHFSAQTGASGQTAVTVAITKAGGVNATVLTRDLRALAERFQATTLPATTHLAVTRDAGQVASARVDSLLEHMLLATLVVVVLVAFTLGRREALIVAVVIPVTLSIVPFVYWLTGFSLNRITLAAMIFSIGILVDDAIVVVENVHRHLQLGGRSAFEATVDAVQEVGNPTILATFTVIGALLPTAFVTGMTGQYLRALPIGACLAMLFSLVVALTVTPYLAHRLLRHGASAPGPQQPRRAWYRRRLEFLLDRWWRSAAVAALVVGLFVAVLALVPTRGVALQLLPRGDTDELAVLVDLPPTSSLQSTQGVLDRLGRRFAEWPEVESCQVYVGAPAPLTFQGVARHTMLRTQPFRGEVLLQLVPREDRRHTSHELAALLREQASQVLRAEGAMLSVSEVPPGPPVLASVVAEISGPDDASRAALTQEVLAEFQRRPELVEVDSTARPARGPLLSFHVDARRAGLQGVNAAQAAVEVRTLLSGDQSLEVTLPGEPEPVPVSIRLPPAQRTSRAQLEALHLTSLAGTAVPATDVGTFEWREPSATRVRKDLVPTVLVTAETVGLGPVYAALDVTQALRARIPVGVRWSSAPADPEQPTVRWAGEWTTTWELFRDLGGAFVVVLFLLYLLLVGWYESFLTALVVMLPVPLALLGVIPAHRLFGLPMTGMAIIGVIALAGLMVRNSILVVDFALANLRQGQSPREAVLLAGQTRLRPIVLTAATVVLGDGVLFFDPLLKGLGLSMAGGALVSTTLTLVLVPAALFWLLTWQRTGARQEAES